MAREIWVNIGSGNGLLPDGTKPLPELMLTDHQWSPVTFILGQFHKRCLNHQSLKSVLKLHLKFHSNFPGANELMFYLCSPCAVSNNMLELRDLAPVSIDLLHKSHNAPVTFHNAPFCNRNVHISVTKWCIVGYLCNALWNLWDGSIWSTLPGIRIPCVTIRRSWDCLVFIMGWESLYW